MNFTKCILVLLITLGTASAWAQSGTKEANKVEIFTYEEKANLQNWFQEEIKSMELTQETEAQYSSIITYYISKIARLDDKDQDYSKEEFKAKLNEYLVKQDKDLIEILSPEQFVIHKDIYGAFLKSAYKRWGIDQ